MLIIPSGFEQSSTSAYVSPEPSPSSPRWPGLNLPWKVCSRCNTRQNLDAFDREKSCPDGRRSECKRCRRAKDTRRNAPPAPETLPALFRGLEGNPEFEALMAAQQGKPLPRPTGIRGPVQVKQERRGDVLRTILVLADIHAPDQHPGFWRALLAFIRRVQPDEIILLGDFLELESCSQHRGANLRKLAEDFAVGNQALDELQAAAPRATFVYLEGNHETRLNRYLSEKAPSLVDSLSVQAGLRLDARGIEWVPEDAQPIARGNVGLLHGHQMEGGRRGGLPKHHAMRAVSIYGQAFRTVTYGHTHKSQAYTEPTIGSIKKAVGLGCGRTLKPGWVHGSEAGWNLEFGVLYLRPSGKTHYYTVEAEADGSFIWNGEEYRG